MERRACVDECCIAPSLVFVKLVSQPHTEQQSRSLEMEIPV
jgi:hypothetical protein